MVRNHKALQRWFRQDDDISQEKQEAFMRNCFPYFGYIVEADEVKAGVVSLKFSLDPIDLTGDQAEFGIGILPWYQKQGIATQAMEQIVEIARRRGVKRIYSDVFVDNPALSWYLRKLQFKAYGVKERAYYKKDVGLVDVVLIERGIA
jgi:RimJ/RimL family protein N-acetyltransferase